jgi:hypothetical protein
MSAATRTSAFCHVIELPVTNKSGILAAGRDDKDFKVENGMTYEDALNLAQQVAPHNTLPTLHSIPQNTFMFIFTSNSYLFSNQTVYFQIKRLAFWLACQTGKL